MTSPLKVSFISNNIKVVGDLYFPPSNAPDRKKAAIVVGHPITGVKEQASANYSKPLSESGFIVLAFDAAYQGESEGEPRLLEDPYQRVEDFKSAVTYLSTLGTVDPERIGALGICGSGGYIPFAAQTDLRIKAVATVSGACIGRLTRKGLPPKGEVTPEALAQNLQNSNRVRIAEAKGEKPDVFGLFPAKPEDVPDSIPFFWRDVANYYLTERGKHPNCVNAWLSRSADLFGNYDSYNFIEMISPRPLLMVAGSDADTKFFSDDAIAAAKEPKELFVVDGETHATLYDHVSVSAPKLANFFGKSLCQ